ncbi:MAG: hypothetical protein IJ809_02020 [Clostridia bacterium]|nr:hypothetical protein [Clostridia bacterium]
MSKKETILTEKQQKKIAYKMRKTHRYSKLEVQDSIDYFNKTASPTDVEAIHKFYTQLGIPVGVDGKTAF